MSILGAIFSLILYHGFAHFLYRYASQGIGRDLYIFFNRKWLFDIVYNNYIVHKVLSFGYNVTFKALDRGVVELVGPTGLVRFFSSFSGWVSRLQSGFLDFYVLFFVIGLILFIGLFGLVGGIFAGWGVHFWLLFVGTVLLLVYGTKR